MNKYIYLGVGALCIVGVPSFIESKYLKQRKGIRKLGQNYLRDSVGKDTLMKKRELKDQIEITDDMHLYHGSLLQYLQTNFTHPFGLIFVRRLESIQRILKIAQKYDIGVMNYDMESLEQYQTQPVQDIVFDHDDVDLMHQQKPFVVINQREIKALHYDQLTGIVHSGVGNRISDINEYLSQFNRCIPIKSDKRLFTILNSNTIPLDSLEYNNIKDIVIELQAVLPNGIAITSPPNGVQKPLGQSLDLTQLFIGQNCRYGILVDVKLMTQPIRPHYIDSIYLDANHVSKSNLYYLLKSIMSITNNQSKFTFHYDHSLNQYLLSYQSYKPTDLVSLLNKYTNQFVNRDIWECNNTIPNNPLITNINQYPIILNYQLSQSGLMECLLQLQDLRSMDSETQYVVQGDLSQNMISIHIKDDKNKTIPNTVILARSLTSYISNRHGRFIDCNDLRLEKLLKQESIPYENGLNHYFIEQEIKRLVDNKNVMLEQYNVLQPTYS